MKRSSTKHLLAGGLLVGLSLGTVPVSAKDDTSPIDPQLQALLTKYHQALKSQDLAAVVSTYAPGSSTVLLGTGPGERWLGQQEIKDAYEHFFADYDRGTMTIYCGSQASGIKGNLAWLLAVCDFTDSLKGKKREYGVNFTAVAEKQDGAWRFRTFHFSNLTGGE
jgi:uncharacterized protein (TIGR02246 family)